MFAAALSLVVTFAGANLKCYKLSIYRMEDIEMATSVVVYTQPG